MHVTHTLSPSRLLSRLVQRWQQHGSHNRNHEQANTAEYEPCDGLPLTCDATARFVDLVERDDPKRERQNWSDNGQDAGQTNNAEYQTGDSESAGFGRQC